MNRAVRAYYKLVHPFRFGFKRFFRQLRVVRSISEYLAYVRDELRTPPDANEYPNEARKAEIPADIPTGRQPAMWSTGRTYANRKRKR